MNQRNIFGQTKAYNFLQMSFLGRNNGTVVRDTHKHIHSSGICAQPILECLQEEKKPRKGKGRGRGRADKECTTDFDMRSLGLPTSHDVVKFLFEFPNLFGTCWNPGCLHFFHQCFSSLPGEWTAKWRQERGSCRKTGGRETHRPITPRFLVPLGVPGLVVDGS